MTKAARWNHPAAFVVGSISPWFVTTHASAVNPMDLINGAHKSVSDLSRVANSAGVDDCATKPIKARPLTVSGAAKAVRIAAFKRVTTSVGVLAGT